MLATAYLDRLEATPSIIDQMIKDSVQFYTTVPPKFRPYFPDIRVLQFEDGSVAVEFKGAWSEFASMHEYEQTLEQLLAASISKRR